MEQNENIAKKLQNLKKKESEQALFKTRQEIALQKAQKIFYQRTTALEQYIHNFFREHALTEHYTVVAEDFPAVTLIQFTNGECLLFYVQAKNLDSDVYTLHSGYILDKDHREEIFDFGESEILEIPIEDIDKSHLGNLEGYLERVVSRHIKFLEDCLEKGYIRRTLHATIKNPWQS